MSTKKQPSRWVENQLRKVHRWCTKWWIATMVKRVDNNMYDVTLWAPKGRSLTIRITTWGYLEYGVDLLLRPDRNEWPYIRRWIRQHGLRRKEWTSEIAQQLSAQLQAALPDYDVSVSETRWGPVLTIEDGLNTLAIIDEVSLFIEDICPVSVRNVLWRVVPKEYQL